MGAMEMVLFDPVVIKIGVKANDIGGADAIGGGAQVAARSHNLF